MNKGSKNIFNIYKYLFFILFLFNIIIGGYLLYRFKTFREYVTENLRQVIGFKEAPEGEYLHGIDVSRYQKIIHWDQLKKDSSSDKIDFVIIKATEGNYLRDKFLTSNFREAKKIGIPIGVYHYYRSDQNSVEQANFFLKNVELSSGDLPPFLDVEHESKIQSLDSFKKGIRSWLSIVEDHYGLKPIIYTNSDFYNRIIKDDFDGYKLWIANYNNVKDPLPEEEWSFWQYTDKGKIDGINENVDLSVFKGNSIQLQNILIK